MKNQNTLHIFENGQFINLTTFHKSGVAVSTPVWFVKQGQSLYVWTARNSGKVKRLLNNPRVQLAPSNFRGKPKGPVEDGAAHLVPQSEHAALEKAFKAKYGMQYRLFSSIGSSQEHVYVEIRLGD